MRLQGNISNRLKMIRDHYSLGAGFGFYPQEVVIELTNHCNLACIMCPHSKMTREKGFMSWELYKKIIGQLKGKTELVYLYGTGESMLHKDVIKYCRHATSNGIHTVLSTNGLPITEKAAEELVTAGLDWLIIALDGGVKETYERIRVKGDFDRLLTNIKQILNFKKIHKSKTKIVLQIIYMDANKGELELFKNLFSNEEKTLIYQFRFKPYYDTYNHPKEDMVHTKPCYWLWNMMAIAWNGDVQLCCMDYDAKYFKANLNNADIYDVWNSEAINTIREKHKKLQYNDIGICRGCDIPEQGYFNLFTILGSAFINASQMRMFIPFYERIMLLSRRWSK